MLKKCHQQSNFDYSDKNCDLEKKSQICEEVRLLFFRPFLLTFSQAILMSMHESSKELYFLLKVH